MGEGLQLAHEHGLVDTLEALRDVGLYAVLGLRVDGANSGSDGLVHRPARAKAVAVGLNLRCPLRFSGVFDQRVVRALIERGNRQRTQFGGPCLGDPHPASRVPAGPRVALLDHRLPWDRREGCETVPACPLLALVVLRDSSPRSILCRPGLH